MPKRRFVRRRGGRFKRRRLGTRGIARRAWRGVRRLNKHIETKQITTTNLAGAISSTATSIILNDITQGNSGVTRVGDRLHIKSVQFKVQLEVTPSTTAAPDFIYPYVAFALLIDKQPNGSTPNMIDIWDISNNTVPYTEFFMGRNWPKRSRFKLIKHKVIRFRVDPVAVDTAGVPTVTYKTHGSRLWKYYHKFKGAGLRTDYFGNAGTIADITKNSLIMIYWSNFTAAQLQVTMYNWQRITFKDG